VFPSKNSKTGGFWRLRQVVLSRSFPVQLVRRLIHPLKNPTKLSNFCWVPAGVLPEFAANEPVSQIHDADPKPLLHRSFMIFLLSTYLGFFPLPYVFHVQSPWIVPFSVRKFENR
jgi:hypothetical protein